MKKKKPEIPVPPESTKTVTIPGHFHIVGIGASAGGLEAFEQFLSNVPKSSGLAFIVIQHLDPTQKGMLPELLQRITPMEVFQVKEKMHVKPNCVYVIPPNKSMSISNGILHLDEPIETRGLRLPIDLFLRSLAEDQKERSIGVVLSGMGSDGTIGLQAIKENKGIVLVQEPKSAKFDSMPRSAIEQVQPDIVAPPNELPEKLITLLNLIPAGKTDPDTEIKDKSSLDKIISLLRIVTGNDFSLYKKNTIYRRIERRMSVHKINKIASYIIFLQENPEEVSLLFKELMIGVTNFFREPLVWEHLKENELPALISGQQTGGIIRAWIPGCSTGEEAFTFAIVFKEVMEKISVPTGIRLQIFGTDLDNEAIETARKGLFPASIASDVSAVRLNRFFTKTDTGYRINTEIREMVVFAQHNLVMHPPFTRIDFLSCRNLLIYMDTELQNKLLSLFYYSLNPDGILLLGSSETLGIKSHLFTSLDSKLKIYSRSPSNLHGELVDFPSSFSRIKPAHIENQSSSRPDVNIQTLADQLLLQNFTPAGVFVTENGDIIYISGRTGKYLEPAVGKANLNIFAMLRDGLRTEFPSAFHKAITSKETVTLNGVKVGTNGGSQIINVTIKVIDKPLAMNGMVMIIFSDVANVPGTRAKPGKGKKTGSALRQLELEEELLRSREEVQATLEEMQSSQEELKSTNEELQSTNEELQSTNEELTTSKEEMQSLNEELQTVNAELQSKVDDFSRVNNDMKNLLNSTDIATLFLDKELKIRRFTNQATKIFKLIKGDIGRPFTDLVSDLDYPELSADATEVLRTLVFIEKQRSTRDGRWFSIRVMPYRTFDDRIDGLVITFFNTSDLRQLEFKLLETEQTHNLILNSTNEVIIKLNPDGKITEFNYGASSLFGKKRDDVLNKDFISHFVPASAQKLAEKNLKKCLTDNIENNVKIPVLAAGKKSKELNWTVHVLTNAQKKPFGLLLITNNQ